MLNYKDENDIPYHFKCLICRKVPKHSMVDVQCSIICCFRCIKQYQLFCSHGLQSCNEVEQSILDQVTFKCKACQNQIAANLKNKHFEVCKIYHSNFQFQNLKNSQYVNQSQINLFCKYCQKYQCQGCQIMRHYENLGKKLILSEQAVELRRQETQVCQFCVGQICYDEIKYHQMTCIQAKTVCELCKQTITRDCYINHYYQCINKSYINLKHEFEINQIGQNLLDILANQFNSDYRQGFLENQLQFYFENRWTDYEE
ncbi:hypothetical protein pb186bvf_008018 [Paramecium bursaria]